MTDTSSLVSLVARRLPLLAGAALVPLAVVVPAHAAAPVICVGNPTGPCDDTAATITAALVKAAANGPGTTVLVGPGTYSDGPYYLYDVTLKGSGQGQTIVTLPANASKQTYVSAENSTVEGLTVKLAAADSSQDTGIAVAENSDVHDVAVDGAGTFNAVAVKGSDSTVSSASISMPLGTDAIGVYGEGGLSVTDSTITAHTGVRHSGANKTDRLARVRITTTNRGIDTDSGTVEADSVLVDLGTSSGTGLWAGNYNAGSAAKAIVGNHVTIVGGGEGSRGAVGVGGEPERRAAVHHLALQLDRRGPGEGHGRDSGHRPAGHGQREDHRRPHLVHELARHDPAGRSRPGGERRRSPRRRPVVRRPGRR